MHGSNAHNQMTGDKGEIFNLCWFKWYNWCYFRDINQALPLNKEKLGQVLGTARGEGKQLLQCILKDDTNVVPCCSLRPLKVKQIHSAKEQNKRKFLVDLSRGDRGHW